MVITDNHSHYGSGRVTAPRRAIARAADGLRRAFTVEDLIAEVRATNPGIGTATVYRAVAAMEANGALARVGMRDDSTLYVRCAIEGHHHHLVCTGCGAVTHARCPLGDDTPRHAGADGFTVTGHELTLYGVCSRCAEDTATNAPSPRKD